MTEIRNVRWPEIEDRTVAPRTQAIVCIAAAMAAWVIVVGAMLLIWGGN